ncbi:MAG: DUF1501 domain-containing protein [Actinobacteria bacterium]|nr:DUF1501 domain-containing protein [Actinomycetota bacterium]
MLPNFSRREFLRLGGGVAVTVGVTSCDRRGTGAADQSSSTTGSTQVSTSGSTSASTVPSTAPTGGGGLAFGGRRLVVVQLNGGNDLLNTLPPTDGRYHDLRPNLALADGDIVSLAGVGDAGLHSSLAPLIDSWDAGRLAFIRGIGFDEPDRSHFISMDRWWRNDQLTQPGWLGRVVDGLADEPSPLFGTALGAGAPVLSGATTQPTVIGGSDSFKWVGVDPTWIKDLGSGGNDDLAALARHAFQRTVQAVDDFAEITGGASTSDELPTREGGATIADGLEVAALLLAADAGAQLVVVSAGGFDTHANQLPVHSNLLADVAAGIVAFLAAIENAGLSDDVMLVVTSEFGRRAAENGSGGCDHGAGGLSLAMGSGVKGGMYGEVDLSDLLDGDVRPTIAPQALFTDCLDWLRVDAEEVLGSRDDSLGLLRS